MSLRARYERGNLVVCVANRYSYEIASYLAMTGLFILFLKSIQSFGLLISIKSTQASTTVFTKVNIIPDISQ